jgi:serine/threonine-protein kinase
VTARALRSEHIVRIWDTGVLATGQPYLVMERLYGTDLDELLEKNGPMPLELVVEVARQTAAALAEAHAVGVVHRDLKPANLFLAQRSDGTSAVKIVDFGISKAPVSKGPALTQASFTLGTPPYMAPEQILCSKDVDRRADIWSLGVTMFELLTGSLPFEGRTIGALAAAILYEPPRKLAELRPDLPARIIKIVERCLAKDVAKRYPNVDKLVRDLDDFVRCHKPHDWSDDAVTTVSTPRRKRSRGRAAVLSMGLLLGVAMILLLAIAVSTRLT